MVSSLHLRCGMKYQAAVDNVFLFTTRWKSSTKMQEFCNGIVPSVIVLMFCMGCTVKCSFVEERMFVKTVSTYNGSAQSHMKEIIKALLNF